MKRICSGGGLSISSATAERFSSGAKGSKMLASRSRTSSGCQSMSACSKGTVRPVSRSLMTSRGCERRLGDCWISISSVSPSPSPTSRRPFRLGSDAPSSPPQPLGRWTRDAGVLAEVSLPRLGCELDRPGLVAVLAFDDSDTGVTATEGLAATFPAGMAPAPSGGEFGLPLPSSSSEKAGSERRDPASPSASDHPSPCGLLSSSSPPSLPSSSSSELSPALTGHAPPAIVAVPMARLALPFAAAAAARRCS
mmetsp:Transcript_80626/g.160156  ORF Transcript_80626/g.160156 Transcript_80626/m.160156 type:complete len:252 (-) Transcript_80626:2061-2816(-)